MYESGRCGQALWVGWIKLRTVERALEKANNVQAILTERSHLEMHKVHRDSQHPEMRGSALISSCCVCRWLAHFPLLLFLSTAWCFAVSTFCRCFALTCRCCSQLSAWNSSKHEGMSDQHKEAGDCHGVPAQVYEPFSAHGLG